MLHAPPAQALGGGLKQIRVKTRTYQQVLDVIHDICANGTPLVHIQHGESGVRTRVPPLAREPCCQHTLSTTVLSVKTLARFPTSREKSA